MNSGDKPTLIFVQTAGNREVIHDSCYQLLLKESQP